MMTDEDRLDDAKRRFLGAQAEIATLRQQIAAAACFWSRRFETELPTLLRPNATAPDETRMI